MSTPNKETIAVLAIFVGIGGIFYFFGIPAFSQYHDFIHQGELNLFASELPASLIPSMSVFDLLKVLIPAGIGITASALYIVLSLLYFIGKKFFVRVFFFAAILDIVARLGLSFITPIFHPLPTLSQNILSGILFTGPFVLCGIISIALLYFLWYRKV
jgi:hypothetical protein